MTGMSPLSRREGSGEGASRTGRLATVTLETVARKLWGFTPNLMPHIVDQRGAGSAIWWFLSNMPRYEKTRRVFGPVRLHILCTMISVLNGCRYCTYGHAYALELCFLDARGSLFPLTEHELVALGSCSEHDASARMRDALNQAGLPDEVHVLDRLLALRAESVAPSGHDDRRIEHLLEMFQVLNSCGIRGNVAEDEAHDPINKNQIIKAGYAALRQAQSAGSD
jgi:hypothetical protein